VVSPLEPEESGREGIGVDEQLIQSAEGIGEREGPREIPPEKIGGEGGVNQEEQDGGIGGENIENLGGKMW